WPSVVLRRPNAARHSRRGTARRPRRRAQPAAAAWKSCLAALGRRTSRAVVIILGRPSRSCSAAAQLEPLSASLGVIRPSPLLFEVNFFEVDDPNMATTTESLFRAIEPPSLIDMAPLALLYHENSKLNDASQFEMAEA